MGWDLRWCMHGKREGLDSHDCPECFLMAREMGMDCSGGATWLFSSTPAELVALREKRGLSEAVGAAERAEKPLRV